MAEPARHFTAKSLAAAWECSEQHIYNLVRDGKLGHFRSGKLIRIRKSDVEDYECQHSSSTNSPETGTSDTKTVTDATERFQRVQAIRMPRK